MDNSQVIQLLREQFEDPRCLEVEQLIDIMHNQLRYHILCGLRLQPFTQKELLEITGGSTSNLSQQLRILTMGGYIEKVLQGDVPQYRLKDVRIRHLIDELITAYRPGGGISVNNEC